MPFASYLSCENRGFIYGAVHCSLRGEGSPPGDKSAKKQNDERAHSYSGSTGADVEDAEFARWSKGLQQFQQDRHSHEKAESAGGILVKQEY